MEAQNTQAADNKALISTEHEMGATLIQSLETQKQMLESLKKMADAPKEEGGSSGGSLLESAADLAGKGGKGKMLGKAAGFLGRNAGKIGAIGGVAMGAYDAYSG